MLKRYIYGITSVVLNNHVQTEKMLYLPLPHSSAQHLPGVRKGSADSTDFFSSKHFHILASFRICLKKGRDGHILILQREVEAEMEPASPWSQG